MREVKSSARWVSSHGHAWHYVLFLRKYIGYIRPVVVTFAFKQRFILKLMIALLKPCLIQASPCAQPFHIGGYSLMLLLATKMR